LLQHKYAKQCANTDTTNTCCNNILHQLQTHRANDQGVQVGSCSKLFEASQACLAPGVCLSFCSASLVHSFLQVCWLCLGCHFLLLCPGAQFHQMSQLSEI
jgi:hypothetical protein